MIILFILFLYIIFLLTFAYILLLLYVIFMLWHSMALSGNWFLLLILFVVLNPLLNISILSNIFWGVIFFIIFDCSSCDVVSFFLSPDFLLQFKVGVAMVMNTKRSLMTLRVRNLDRYI